MTIASVAGGGVTELLILDGEELMQWLEAAQTVSGIPRREQIDE